MLLEYVWSLDQGPAPEANSEVDVSGDPDKPVLRGTIFKAVPGEDIDLIVLSILMADGQLGANELQEWITDGNELGIMAAGQPPSKGVFER